MAKKKKRFLDDKPKAILNVAEQEIIRIVEDCIDRTKFAKYFFPQHFDKPFAPFHMEMHDLADEYRFLAIAAPREHAKTTSFTFLKILHSIAYRLNKFIVIVSDTYEQACLFLEDIHNQFLKNVAFTNTYDLHMKGGKDTLIINDEMMIKAMGSGQKFRGIKFRQTRPDLVICHSKGSKIWENGRLVKIENTSFKKKQVKSILISVKVQGVPYEEKVTLYHRFMCAEKYKYYGVGSPKNNRSGTWKFAEREWCEAINLTKNHWIGSKIDYELMNPEPIKKYKGCKITSRDNKGMIVKGSKLVHNYVNEIPDYFNTDEFYYFLGRWMGDGVVSKNPVICFNKKDKKGIEIIVNFWKSVNKPCSVQEGETTITVNASDLAFGRWLKSWSEGNSIKIPPMWVRKQNRKRIVKFIQGYIDSDGWVDKKKNQVRITSINYEGLLIIQQMLARIDVPSYIRKGTGPRQTTFSSEEYGDRTYLSKQKYDILISHKANSVLGYDIVEPSRYGVYGCFIKDGFLWKKVCSCVKEKQPGLVVPVKTNSGTYESPLGLSHNCDDIENDELVENPERRAKMRRWFFGALRPSLGKKGKMIVIGTILHEDGLLARLLKDPEFYSKLYQIIGDDKQPLWPAIHTLKTIETLRKQYEKRHQLTTFYQEFFNVATSPENRKFQLSWLKYYKLQEIDRPHMLKIWPRFLLVDLAHEDEALRIDTAFHALVVVAYDPDNDRRYILDYKRFKDEFDAVVEIFFELVETWKIKRAGIEVVGAQKHFYQHIRSEARKRNVHINLTKLPHTRSKHYRIMAMQYPMKIGKYYIMRWMTEFEQELISYPKGVFVDVIDATASLEEMINIVGCIKPAKAGGDDSFDDRLRGRFGRLSKYGGTTNGITGY